MLTLLPGGRILLAVEPVDGRKGIDSFAGVVRAVLKGDPMSGDLFVFKNRRGDKLKILRLTGLLLGHPKGSELAQLVVHERQQLRGGVPVAAGGRFQSLRDVAHFAGSGRGVAS
jgi:transposase